MPDATEPCRWPGWVRAPIVRPGCVGVCVPTDLEAESVEVRWVNDPELCDNCSVMGTPWAEEGTGAVLAGLFASGGGPDFHTVGMRGEHASTTAIYDAQRDVTLSMVRNDYLSECGRTPGLGFSQDGRELGMYLYNRTGQDDQLFVAGPVERAAELLRGEPTLRFPLELVGTAGINEMQFSERFVVVDLSGRVLIGDRNSKSVTDVARLPGAPPGFYNEFAIAGENVFVNHHDGVRNSWWLYSDGTLTKLLGDERTTIRSFASDGKIAVWGEASLESSAEGEVLEDTNFTVYTADATPELRDRRVLIPSMHGVLSYPVFANGYLVAVTYLPDDDNVIRAWVIELASGKIYESVLSERHSWGFVNYPTRTELWGAMGGARWRLNEWETLIRVPYTSMTVIQAGYPD